MKKPWFVVLALMPLVVIGSIAVWQVSGDDARRVGALQPLEKSVPLSWRGAWSEGLAYQPGELVSFEGAAFVAQAENTASKPDPWCEDDCMWALLADRGAQGPKGDPGPQGPQGPPADLSNLVKIDAGGYARLPALASVPATDCNGEADVGRLAIESPGGKVLACAPEPAGTSRFPTYSWQVLTTTAR